MKFACYTVGKLEAEYFVVVAIKHHHHVIGVRNIV